MLLPPRRFTAVILIATSGSASLAAQSDSTQLSVERIFTKREFTSAPLPSLQWMKDGVSYVDQRPAKDGGSDIIRVNAVTGAATVLAAAALTALPDGKRLNVEEIHLSADETKTLLFHSSVRVWRSNTRGVYHVLDFASKKLAPVSRTDGLQMFAKFSPDGRQVGFVRDNNIFVTDLASGAERQLTSDGSDVIINGTTDWVYEEELALRDAFRWSPDSRRIAYWRFDQSPVPIFPMVDQLKLYPTVTPLRYPKAGEPNSRVKVGVLEVATGRTTWLDTDTGEETYLARMDWVGSDSVIIQRLPRKQNRVDLLMMSATSGQGRTVLSERDSTWIDADEQPVWVNGGKQFVWSSERSGWRQYYLYNRGGSLVRLITDNRSDVSGLLALDEKRGFVYVTEAVPTPMERQVIRYSLNGRGARTRLTQARGTHRGSLAPGGRYLVDAFSSASTPATLTLYELPGNVQRRVLVDNAALKVRLATLAIKPPEFFKIPAVTGDSLNAYRIVPADFDSSRKYPVLMYVYGGPGSQTVTDDFGSSRYLWHQLLAQKGYIVVSVDNRGTGSRGRAFRTVTYLNLGKHEADDQINAARWLAKQSWVDGGRIGIWGWSYGGYMSSLSAGRGGEVFKAAIAVAPVTDWRLYDSIYTERYMWIPQENANGYGESAPLKYAKDMKAKLLLIHGTGDDNVHPENSIQLVNALQTAGKQFQLMLYPNRTHSISGGNTQAHLYELMTRFIIENL